MTKDEAIITIRKNIEKHDFFYDIQEELKSNIFYTKIFVSIMVSFVYIYLIPFVLFPAFFKEENFYSDYKFFVFSSFLVIFLLSFIFLLSIYNRFKGKNKKGILNFIRYIPHDLSNIFHIHNIKDIPLHFKIYEKLSKHIKEDDMLKIMEYKLKYSDFNIYYIYSGNDPFYLNRVNQYNKEFEESNQFENAAMLKNIQKIKEKKNNFVESLYCTKKDKEK